MTIIDPPFGKWKSSGPSLSAIPLRNVKWLAAFVLYESDVSGSGHSSWRYYGLDEWKLILA